MAGHVVGDQRGRNPVLLQFPSREAGALKKRPRFIGENVDFLAGLYRGANDSECGPISCPWRARPRCNASAPFSRPAPDGCAVASDRLADRDIFEANLLRFPDHALSTISRAWSVERSVQPPHRSIAQNRFTAVGRVSASVVQIVSKSAPSATPKSDPIAAATPMAGAPRITMVSNRVARLHDNHGK